MFVKDSEEHFQLLPVDVIILVAQLHSTFVWTKKHWVELSFIASLKSLFLSKPWSSSSLGTATMIAT